MIERGLRGFHGLSFKINIIRVIRVPFSDVFADYNDINDDTRMQLELINQTIAELQSGNQQEDKPRNPIGFIKPNK